MIAAKNSVHQLQDTVFVKYRNESIIIINTCVVSSVIILPFMGTLFFIFYHLSRKRQSTFHQYSFISHSIFIYCRQKFNPTAFSLLLFCVFVQGCKFEAKRINMAVAGEMLTCVFHVEGHFVKQSLSLQICLSVLTDR